MRLIYVTSQFPWGVEESFFLPEVRELVNRGNDLTIFPILPGSQVPRDRAEFGRNSVRLPLLSGGLLMCAVRMTLRHSALARWASLVREGSGSTRAKNTLVFAKALWLSEFAQRNQVDHIHALWATTSATVAMVASEISGVPWSFSAHRGDLESPNVLVRKVKSAAFVRFICESGQRGMRSAFGENYASKLLVRHLGVYVPERRYYHSSSPARVGLCVASLIPRKGHVYLFHAIRALLASGLNVQILLAGRGDHEEFLRREAHDLIGSDAVRFLGHLPNEEVLSLYKRNRVGFSILPSLHEGIPVALMEAMAHGVPVIATDAGGTRELLERGAGILVPPGSDSSLAQGILRLTGSATERQRLSRCGYERVKHSFNVKLTASELESLCYRHSVSGCRPFANSAEAGLRERRQRVPEYGGTAH